MTKTVYLLRHGDAFSVGENGILTDEDRTLTPKGMAQLEKQAAGFHRLGETLHSCFSSPLIRAVQSAKMMLAPFGKEKELETTELLGNYPSFELIIKRLKEHTCDYVLLAGHAPFMGQLMSKLVCGHIYGAMPFSKGSMCRIDLMGWDQEPHGHLQWFMKSYQLQQLSGS